MPLRVVAVDVESLQRFTGYSILLLGRRVTLVKMEAPWGQQGKFLPDLRIPATGRWSVFY